MRHIVFVSLLASALAMPGAAISQPTPTRSVDDYVCAFADECDDAETAEQADAEEAKLSGQPRRSSTRSFGLANPNRARSSTDRPPPQAGRKVGGNNPPQRQNASVSPNRPAGAPAAARGQRADLRLGFQLGSSDLTEIARAEARVFAESLMRPQLQAMRFTIEGHTDSQGNRQYNLGLSQRRAQAVADYLVSLGVGRDRLQVRGYGFDRPIPGRSARAQENRRVEAVRTS